MKMVNKLQTIKGFRNFLPVKISKATKVGIFIDDANLFYAQKRLGWKIDWAKILNILKKDLNLKIARYYLGMPLSGQAKIANTNFQKRLESFGYTVVTKPLKRILLDNKTKQYKNKCNFDVEIALDIATFITSLDLIIIASGDSDLVAIKDFGLMNKKMVVFLCYEKNVAWEIRYAKFVFLEKLRKFIELRQKRPRQQGRGEITV